MSAQAAIRAAVVGDLNDIQQIWVEGIASAIPREVSSTCQDAFAHFESMLLDQRPPFRIWVATTSGNEVIGWQALMPCRNNPLLRDKMAESSTYVRRHTGVPNIGQILLSHAVDYAHTTELEYIIGFVASTNRAAIRMVLACGFTHLGLLPPSPRAAATGQAWVFCRAV